MYGYEYEYAKQEAMDAADSYSAEEIRQADREEIEAKISALRDSLAAMNKEA
jgi:ribosomal protein L29